MSHTPAGSSDQQPVIPLLGTDVWPLVFWQDPPFQAEYLPVGLIEDQM